MKIILPGIAMIAVVYAFARFSFGLFLPNITSSIRITESQAGIASSAAYVSYTLALLFSSFSLKKFGQLRVIQLAGLSAVIGLVGIAFSYNFYVLLMSTFIAGIGSGLASPAFSQVATTRLQDQSRIVRIRGLIAVQVSDSFCLVQLRSYLQNSGVLHLSCLLSLRSLCCFGTHSAFQKQRPQVKLQRSRYLSGQH